MKLKSYFSGTVEAAMALARKELGDDALLVNARPAPAETRSLGAFEVVFGVLSAGASKAESPRAESAGLASPPGSGPRSAHPLHSNIANGNTANSSPMSSDLADLKREMARIAHALRAMSAPQTTVSSEEWDLRTRLRDAELDPELVEKVVQGTRLNDLFAVDAALGRPGARAVIALVGPPGAGKTTTLIKLAARYGLACRRPAHIISTDVVRIAAADQLRALAAILGIGCTVVETPAALTQVLEEQSGKEYVFIDTPGLGCKDMPDGAAFAHVLGAHPGIDTHLVLPASMRPADLSDAIDRYLLFRPTKLLFTRLDESSRFGALVSESARRLLPISFLTSGQQIPDDLEPATKERLSDLVYGSPRRSAMSIGATA